LAGVVSVSTHRIFLLAGGAAAVIHWCGARIFGSRRRRDKQLQLDHQSAPPDNRQRKRDRFIECLCRRIMIVPRCATRYGIDGNSCCLPLRRRLTG